MKSIGVYNPELKKILISSTMSLQLGSFRFIFIKPTYFNLTRIVFKTKNIVLRFITYYCLFICIVTLEQVQLQHKKYCDINYTTLSQLGYMPHFQRKSSIYGCSDFSLHMCSCRNIIKYHLVVTKDLRLSRHSQQRYFSIFESLLQKKLLSKVHMLLSLSNDLYKCNVDSSI